MRFIRFLAGAAFSVLFAASASAAPVTYTVSGTGSWQVGSLGNSGGTFVFTFDGGDTSTVGDPSGGFQFSNSPMSATIALSNGGGPVYSGVLTYGSQMTLNQNVGGITIFNQDPSFDELFGFTDTTLTTATLTDIGYSLAVDIAGGNVSAIPSGFIPIQNADGDTYVSFEGVSSLNFSIDAGATGTTPLPAALPLFVSGLGAIALFGLRRKRRAQPTS